MARKRGRHSSHRTGAGIGAVGYKSNVGYGGGVGANIGKGTRSTRKGKRK